MQLFSSILSLMCLPMHSSLQSCVDIHNLFLNVWLWRRLCPKYTCLLTTGIHWWLPCCNLLWRRAIGMQHLQRDLSPGITVTCTFSCILCKGVLIFHHVPVVAYAASFKSTFYFWRGWSFSATSHNCVSEILCVSIDSAECHAGDLSILQYLLCSYFLSRNSH